MQKIKSTNPTKTKLIDIEQNSGCPREGGGRKTKRVKEVKYMAMVGNQTSGGKHTIEYTNVISECYTPEIYINQYQANKFNSKLLRIHKEDLKTRRGKMQQKEKQR